MYELRPRQKEAGNAVVKSYRTNRNKPIVVDATVGFGKSILIACLAEYFVRQGEKVLVLAHTEELIIQNSEAYHYDKSIYCASLGKKNTGHPVTFASEISMANIENMPDFTVVLIDECDRVNDRKENSSYMKIITRLDNAFICGFTGTPFRLGHGLITGDSRLFKEVIYQASMAQLIEDNHLVPITLPEKTIDGYDFSEVAIRGGKFVAADISKELKQKHRLTHYIIEDVLENYGDRHAYMFFACTKEHASEIMESLPEPKILITGSMGKKDRRQAIKDIKNHKYKYIVNVNVLTVGFNYTALDTIVFMRPTESPRLFIQATGRGVRTAEGKHDCLLLDYAGNLERHGGLKAIMNNDLALEAGGDGQSKENYGLYCPECGFDNKQTAHKCRVCDHYFVSQECPSCEKENSVSARHCWNCGFELIDPNSGLSRVPSGNITYRAKVNEMTFVTHTSKAGNKILKVGYLCTDLILYEFFTFNGKGAYYLKNINKFYKGDESPEGDLDWYLNNSSDFDKPKYIEYVKEGKYYHVKRRC